MATTNTTDDPFLLAIAAFACLFDAQLARETRAARGGEAEASAVAVTPPPMPPMVLHAASLKQGFDPDLPPSRWLPSVARAVRQRQQWGADELLKSLQCSPRCSGDYKPFPRLRALMPLLEDWRIVDSIAAWLADEPPLHPVGGTNTLLYFLAKYHVWHKDLDLPFRVHERDTMAATVIQLLRAASPRTVASRCLTLRQTFQQLLQTPTISDAEGAEVQPLMVVAVREMQLLEVLVVSALDHNNLFVLESVLWDVCEVIPQLRPCDVEALRGIFFNPTGTTSSQLASMRVRFMARYPEHTTAEDVRLGLKYAHLNNETSTVQHVIKFIEWSIGHRETHHHATIFDSFDGAQLLRHFFDSIVTYLDAASAADVILTMLRAHSAGLIDLCEQRQWIMLLADIASRFRLLSNNGGGGTDAVVVALAGVPAVDAEVRKRYRG